MKVTISCLKYSVDRFSLLFFIFEEKLLGTKNFMF